MQDIDDRTRKLVAMEDIRASVSISNRPMDEQFPFTGYNNGISNVDKTFTMGNVSWQIHCERSIRQDRCGAQWHIRWTKIKVIIVRFRSHYSTISSVCQQVIEM